MKILDQMEQHISISAIILLPVIISLLPNILYILFFPNDARISAFLAFFVLFMGGFTGLLIMYYKRVPGMRLIPKQAMLIGGATSFLAWLTLLLLALDFFRN